jgi:hypothetical protein
MQQIEHVHIFKLLLYKDIHDGWEFMIYLRVIYISKSILYYELCSYMINYKNAKAVQYQKLLQVILSKN